MEQHGGVVNVKVEIDDSKVHVITRAQRLRGVTVEALAALKRAVDIQVVQNPEERDRQSAELAEAIGWLNELEV